jgi:ATP-dependent Clp protease ATP-binding subunit ClpB
VDGHSVSKLVEKEKDKLLLGLADILHQRVIGQDEAVTAVSEAVLRARSGLKDPKRPHRFVHFPRADGRGQDGAGARARRGAVRQRGQHVRIDMSEYMEKHSVARLIGAPPGYVGYDEGGQLTEAVRRKPYCVILFDEIEKAHHDVFNVLLQLLDDGRLTDSQGRTVNFKNTVVIMTSNLGSEYLLTGIDAEGNLSDEARLQVMSALSQSFRPEFLNRVDDIVMFKPLTKEDVIQIIGLAVKAIQKRLDERGILLKLTDAAKALIADKSYTPVYGARPVKRYLQKEIETQLGRMLLAGSLSDGGIAQVDAKNGELKISVG